SHDGEMAALRCARECVQMFTCAVIQRCTTGTVRQPASHPCMMFYLLSLLETEAQSPVRLLTACVSLSSGARGACPHTLPCCSRHAQSVCAACDGQQEPANGCRRPAPR